MPKQIITRINAETVKQLKTDDLKTRFQNGGADAAFSMSSLRRATRATSWPSRRVSFVAFPW